MRRCWSVLEPRYAALSSVLAAATRALPTTRDDLELERLVEREFRRLRERGKLGRSISNAALHKRRIRVKRARYAAELVLERNPRAESFVAEAKRFEDLLGAHQDAASPGAVSAASLAPPAASIRQSSRVV